MLLCLLAIAFSVDYSLYFIILSSCPNSHRLGGLILTIFQSENIKRKGKKNRIPYSPLLDQVPTKRVIMSLLVTSPDLLHNEVFNCPPKHVGASPFTGFFERQKPGLRKKNEVY